MALSKFEAADILHSLGISGSDDYFALSISTKHEIGLAAKRAKYRYKAPNGNSVAYCFYNRLQRAKYRTE